MFSEELRKIISDTVNKGLMNNKDTNAIIEDQIIAIIELVKGIVPEKRLEDFRNIIIHINESTGINEKGKEDKCLFISIDGQYIFNPLRKDGKNFIAISTNYLCGTRR
jgi:hypothetical protein